MTESKTGNQIIELEITSYGSEGQGVGRKDALAVFVKGALVGERVRAEIVKNAPRFAEARLVEVLEVSQHRLEPACPNYSRCGGCDLMHMDRAHQLEFKRMKVENAFRRIGGFDAVQVQPCVPSPSTLRYRNKAVFSFRQSGGRVVSGTIEEHSHRVVAASDCLLQTETALKALQTVTKWANDLRIPAFDEASGKGILRRLMVREASTGEVMAVIIAAKRPPEEKELVSRLLSAVPSLKSIVLSLNSDRKNTGLGRACTTVFGSQRIRERILGLDYSANAQSFLQINHAQTEALYSFAVDSLMLTERDSAVDLYCGIGSISLLMAQRARSVIGIEYVSKAIEDANENAKRNGIQNASFICGAAETVLPRLVQGGMRISRLLLDPPRAGAMRPALDAISACAPNRITYVSCDPATLARDCRILVNEGGYAIECIQPFDMFPQTRHVECVVLMTKK